MELRSPIKISPNRLIDRRTAIITAGSCFADNLGEKLQTYKFDCQVNPFGTQFHPLAIFDLLTRSLKNEDLPSDLFLRSDGATYHYYLPRTQFADSVEQLQSQFRSLAASTKKQFQADDNVLMLTFGTAFIFEKGERWVSNCHQQSSKLFSKRLLPLDEMLSAARSFVKILPAQTKIILTLSPVRHLREGLEANSLSKSLLRVFIHEFQALAPDRISYFPAYEIMIDELRDYRFYKDDLTHPTDQAITYIWELFQAAQLQTQAQKQVQILEPLLTALRHRSLRPDSPSQRVFQQKLLADLRAIEDIDLTDEVRQIQAILDK